MRYEPTNARECHAGILNELRRFPWSKSGRRAMVLTARAIREGRRWIALPVLALVLPIAAHAADKAPRHTVKPVSTITIKVMPDADYAAKEAKADHTITADGKPAHWIITAGDSDSCTAWVPMRYAGTAEAQAFRACRNVIDNAVDTAHAAAER